MKPVYYTDGTMSREMDPEPMNNPPTSVMSAEEFASRFCEPFKHALGHEALPTLIALVKWRDRAIEQAAMNAAYDKAIKELPTSWLDPLLTGKTSISIPWNCPEVEQFVAALKRRIELLKTPSSEAQNDK